MRLVFATLVLSSTTFAQSNLPVPYALEPGHFYHDGCYDPCDCLFESFPLIGTFDLVAVSLDPVQPMYDVLDVRFRDFPDIGFPSTTVGGGTYELINGIVQTERMQLSLSRNDRPFVDFDSGWDFGIFPEIDLAVSLNGMVCYDRVYEVVAAPRAEAGSSFCTSTPNSTGEAAVIRAFGNPAVAGDGLELRADFVPPGFGLFFVGLNPEQTPFGNGFRCAGPPAFRLFPVLQTDNFGRARLVLDLSSLAGGGSPGETRYFQYAYRDNAAGGAGFNLTDGVAVVLE